MATNQTPAQTSPASDDKKSPLDALEQILNDAKGAKQAGDKVAEAKAKAAQAAEEEARVQAEMEQQREAQRAEDATQLQQEISKLQDIKSTPQYQARVEQQEAEKQEDEEEAQAQEGFEIRQLGHTKI